jgi:tetratricopeptide (TPR) repeat protein
MPTPDELLNKVQPIFSRGFILFLNDLHEYRDLPDWKLLSYVQCERFKVIATIPSEKFDPDWSLLSQFAWNVCRVQSWSELDGQKLAQTIGKKFDSQTFRGTPLSVIAPDAEMKRAFELLPSNEKSILQALKVVKMYLGAFVDFELISEICAKPVSLSTFLSVISKGYWCRTYDSRALLADGIEESVNYLVKREDAYNLQQILSSTTSSLQNRPEYLFYLGNRLDQLEDYSRALKCYRRSLELLVELRYSPATAMELRGQIQTRWVVTKTKAFMTTDKRVGLVAYVWPNVGRVYSALADVKLNEAILGTLLTGSTCDLTFAVKAADLMSSATNFKAIKSNPLGGEITSQIAIVIYLPPGFSISGAYPFTTKDDSLIQISKASIQDPYGPGWLVARISCKFNSSSDGFAVVPYDDSFISIASDRRYCYIRAKGVTAPSIAGRYFFKIALHEGGESSMSKTEITPLAEQDGRALHFIPMENWPVISVKGEVTPATISGTIRRAQDGLTIGAPIQRAGKVWAKMTMRLDPYTSQQRPDLPKVHAVGYFNATAQGHYEVEGLAAGIYDLYASAAGLPQTPVRSGFTVLMGQSLHFDLSLQLGPVLHGIVSSYHQAEEVPWRESGSVEIGVCNGPTLIEGYPRGSLVAWAGGPDKSHIARASNDIGPSQDWLVKAGTKAPFHFGFGLKDEYGAPTDLDGMVPQVYATWVNGLTPGTYYVRASISEYAQTDARGQFIDYQFFVKPQERAQEIELQIRLQELEPIRQLARENADIALSDLRKSIVTNRKLILESFIASEVSLHFSISIEDLATSTVDDWLVGDLPAPPTTGEVTEIVNGWIKAGLQLMSPYQTLYWTNDLASKHPEIAEQCLHTIIAKKRRQFPFS